MPDTNPDIDYRHAMQILRDAQMFSPAIVMFGGRYHIFSRTHLLASGQTITEALTAGEFLPAPVGQAPPSFSAKGVDIFQGEGVVAQARSVTMAKRIVNALNEYVPSWRKY